MSSALPPISRRSLLSGAAALAATGFLTACGPNTSDDADGGGGDASGWSFTDDRGEEITLDRTPTRIAGLNDAIASLWNYGITPVASFGATGLGADVNFEGKDHSQVTEVGTTYGEINLVRLQAQKPDLIVVHAYPEDESGEIDPNKPLFGFKDIKQQEDAAAIAPIVAISMTGSADKVVERTTEFARSLGVEQQLLDEKKSDYDAARERLREAASSGVTVMAVAAYETDGVHIAKAEDDPALRSYTELGMKYPDPGGDEYYWRQAAWENITQFRTDVVLYSLRAMSGDDMLKQPTFATMPAAQAGQVYPWEFSAMDYVAQAGTINRLADNLEGARRVV
ncbi:Fe3+-hydroxamate ABC transporter substrate-binding protein [Saccharomonospora sp. CUA-673]|uniref:ABC transporter substrate-binding protein n=1 Tax=Saccharomonospora sp. CUA-673 TaxID=1904969 RepID=UPI0009600BD9|nr:ABC transporter substrate-binding protein [Saccharomonospora sp. CUA-673]OLT46606.1 Fe3+-hydroxamate ABC transporter substrate-binding protein [Saccharomonospora sp. CUA-673]